jgi:hypothetical protein
MSVIDRQNAIGALAKKLNALRESSLVEHEVAYANPRAEFKKYGINPPLDLLWLYQDIICCRDSNHEGGTTRFLPIDEMANFPEDIQNGYVPFYDQLNFCWTLYVKTDEFNNCKVYCEYEATEKLLLKLDFEGTTEAFLERVARKEDVFSEVNGIILKVYPRIKL